MIHFNIFLPSMLPFLQACYRNFACIYFLPHASYMPYPSDLSWYDHPNIILWRLWIMELLIMSFLHPPATS
jgi:hypothetical protein